MTDRDQLLEQLADDVKALVEPRKHRQPYWTWTSSRHKRVESWPTDQPSLLNQLRAQVPPGGPEDDADGTTGSGGMESTPPLALEVLDRLMAIEAGSAAWVSWVLELRLRDTVEDNLRAMVGAAPSLPHVTDPPKIRPGEVSIRSAAHNVRRWHGWAATLTGWQSPPWAPHVPCPLCATLDSLRINLVANHATCMACAEVWDESDGSIGLLADHIRATDTRQMRTWEESCAHSWRLTTVGSDGIRGWCVACHATDVRPTWPKGTPVLTDLDEQTAGASA